MQIKHVFIMLIRVKIENKLITSCFATCAFASVIAQDALNTLLESPAIIEVKRKKQVLLLLLMLLVDWQKAFRV